MFGGISNLTVATSLQYLLNIILNKHFQEATCIVQKETSAFYDFSLTTANQIIPQYINPAECTPGCCNYILYDPLRNKQSNQLNACFRQHSDYHFKGIILLDQDKIEHYIFSNKDRSVPSFAGNSIFVSKKTDRFIIEAFDHWYANTHIVLNRWNILEKKFENEFIDDFFSDQRRKLYNGQLGISAWSSQIPFFLAAEKKGSELILLVEFAKQMNMQYNFYFNTFNKPPLSTKMFELGQNGAPQRAIQMGVYPVSSKHVTFLVTKPKPYILPMTLFKVLSLNLWMLIIVSYLLFSLVFWIENKISYDWCPRFNAVVGMFLLQGLNDQDVPRYFRGRCLLALMLILTVLYSSIFASGIVDQMMTVNYKGDVNTIKELADSNYPVYCLPIIFKYLEYDRDYASNISAHPHLTDVEKRALKRFENINYWDPNLEYFAVEHAITQSKLSTELVSVHKPAVNWTNVKSMNNYFYHKMYTGINLTFKHNHYMLLLPLLEKHLLRCNSAGLMIKWEMDAYRAKATMKTILTALDVKPPPNEPSALQFDHIRDVLISWFVGLVLATMILLIEQLWVLLTYQLLI